MYKVLLVDDEDIILKGMKEIIKWEDYNLTIGGEAQSAAQAEEIIKSMKIDILITDICMKEKTGIDLIRFIRESDINIKCIVLSGYSEFEYVKEAAKLGIENYILKPIDKNELIATLTNTVAKIEDEYSKLVVQREGEDIIRNNIISRWMKGDIEDNELHERAEVLNIDIKASEYMVVIIKETGGEDASHESESSDISLLCSRIIGEKEQGMAVKDSASSVALIIKGSSWKAEWEGIERALEKCRNAIEKEYKREVFIIAGSVERGYRNLSRSYYNARSLMDYSLIFDNSHILIYDDIKEYVIKWNAEERLDLNPLIRFIKEKNSDEVINFIRRIFENIRKREEISPAYIQNLAVDVLFSLISTIRGLNCNMDEVFNGYKDLFSKVYTFMTIEDMEKWLEGIAEKFMGILSYEDSRISPAVRKVLEYIKDNYHREINLSTISYGLGLNSFYLGQQFKKETGESFTNALNRLRIDYAKELLKSTNMKTVEIAKKAGYSNTNYFSTVFKKITGCTPSEYRED